MTPLVGFGLAAIAIVVFLFVIEPILRARSDEVLLDSAPLPRPLDPRDDDDDVTTSDDDPIRTLQPDEQDHDAPTIAARRVSSDVV